MLAPFCLPTTILTHQTFTNFPQGSNQGIKEHGKKFSFTLTFSVVCLFNHFFTVNQILTTLGTKLMTIMKCLTSKDEETQQTKIMMSSLEQSVRACLSLRISPGMWSNSITIHLSLPVMWRVWRGRTLGLR